MTATPMFFATPAQFGEWLAAHAATAPFLVVGFHKVDSGEPSMRWGESVDEALCVGWIDGVRKRIDEQRYQIRFTPRKPGSIWSAVNIAKFEQLVAAGRIQPAGLAAFERRSEARSRVYAYEQAETASLTAPELALFQSQPQAWQFFEALAPGYRRTAMHHLHSAKRPETRAVRLARLIARCAAGERPV